MILFEEKNKAWLRNNLVDLPSFHVNYMYFISVEFGEKTIARFFQDFLRNFPSISTNFKNTF